MNIPGLRAHTRGPLFQPWNKLAVLADEVHYVMINVGRRWLLTASLGSWFKVLG